MNDERQYLSSALCIRNLELCGAIDAQPVGWFEADPPMN